MRTKRQGHMDQTERAKQFMAFSPLKGLDQCIRAAEEEPEERRELLEDEGVEFKANGCVDMKRHQWEE